MNASQETSQLATSEPRRAMVLPGHMVASLDVTTNHTDAWAAIVCDESLHGLLKSFRRAA